LIKTHERYAPKEGSSDPSATPTKKISIPSKFKTQNESHSNADQVTQHSSTTNQNDTHQKTNHSIFENQKEEQKITTPSTKEETKTNINVASNDVDKQSKAVKVDREAPLAPQPKKSKRLSIRKPENRVPEASLPPAKKIEAPIVRKAAPTTSDSEEDDSHDEEEDSDIDRVSDDDFAIKEEDNEEIAASIQKPRKNSVNERKEPISTSPFLQVTEKEPQFDTSHEHDKESSSSLVKETKEAKTETNETNAKPSSPQEKSQPKVDYFKKEYDMELVRKAQKIVRSYLLRKKLKKLRMSFFFSFL
jgi:hypothetical protein